MNELIAAFTPDRAARIIGTSTQQLAHWFRNGLSTPRYVDESGWLGVKRLYSFKDLVLLRTLLALRDDFRVSTTELRKANEFLMTHYEEPWARLTLYVLDGILFFDEPAMLLRMAAARPWQQALPLPMEPIIHKLGEAVRRELERQPDQIGRIRQHRNVMGNAPCIDGTRIPTAVIWSLHTAGYGTEAIIAEYPDLAVLDVEQAIAYESEQRKRRGQRRTA